MNCLDFEKFLNEYYQGQRAGEITLYCNEHWDEVLSLFGDSPEIFDKLSEVCMIKNEEEYETVVRQLMEVYDTTKDFRSFKFDEKPSLEDTVKDLQAENAMLKGSVMELSSYLLNRMGGE